MTKSAEIRKALQTQWDRTAEFTRLQRIEEAARELHRLAELVHDYHGNSYRVSATSLINLHKALMGESR